MRKAKSFSPFAVLSRSVAGARFYSTRLEGSSSGRRRSLRIARCLAAQWWRRIVVADLPVLAAILLLVGHCACVPVAPLTQLQGSLKKERGSVHGKPGSY